MAERVAAGSDVVTLRDQLAAGAVSARAVAEACFARVDAREETVKAFAWLDRAHILAEADARDRARATGRPIGALHGLPVALKDVIDTARIPTENGTPLDAGRVPVRDAFVAARLRAEGAVIFGKTVTTELAFLHPSHTTNPHNADHTPGGSSSGSAAAVAAGMVPLAVGTQTGGSVIRPAAFCGVTGFKPSFGAIPRTGVLSQSPSLDTLGVFAADAAGAALLAEALFGHDPGDPASAPAPHPKLLAAAGQAPPLPPIFAFARPPGWDRAHPDMQRAMEELAEALGPQCFPVDLPAPFAEAAAVRERINLAEMAKCFHHYAKRGHGALSEAMQAAIAAGEAVPARDYIAARDWPGVLNAGLDEIFERADAILTPAALGPAPEGLGSTGDSLFNGLWTLCGTPAITLPVFESGAGLPMGAQLTGPRWADGRLLRTAAWLMRFLAGAAPSTEETTP